jgi:hypothetical protein
MKKFLKAQDIKVEFIVSADVYDKAAFEQLILVSKRSLGWGVNTNADLIITHCDTDDGSFVAFKTIYVAPGATGTVLDEVNLVAMKQFFKIGIEADGPAALVEVVAIFTDNRLVNTAEDVLPLVVNPTPTDTLVLNSFSI